MGKITILPETTKNPISLMGERAGVCWGADVTDQEKNYKRGLDCLESGHGRVQEYVNVEMIIDGYSARAIREWYTHIGGAPTRLQASTRYINYKKFEFVLPPSIKANDEAFAEYLDVMDHISAVANMLETNFNIPREDVAMMLPLGMTTKVVDKRNLRNLIDMSRQRMCNRAYWEYRNMMRDICKALSDYSEEWKYLVEKCFYAKCEDKKCCSEKKSCGKYLNENPVSSSKKEC